MNKTDVSSQPKIYGVCSKASFYDGLCPALIASKYCTQKTICGVRISEAEARSNAAEVAKAKALLERLGYDVIKRNISK